MTAPKKIGPSKSVAAAFLRELSERKYLSVPDPARTGADLRLIAHCILGEARWNKSGKYAPGVQVQINFFARMVEDRPRGQSVSDALDRWAKELAKRLGRSDDPDAEQELRDAIARARKEGRKSGK